MLAPGLHHSFPMKIWAYCLILILSIGWVKPAVADPSQDSVLDRQAIFEKAYQLLPSALEAALDMGFYNNEFSGDEMRTFDKIRQVVLSDFQAARKDRLVFSSDQNLFKLDPSQPIRTAVTSSDPKDPVFVNLKVINASANQFELENALQILVHEYGHKITGKNQAVVDSVATKLQGFLFKHITRTTSDRGDTLTALTLPNLVGGSQLTQLIDGRSEQEKTLLMTALLFQNSKKVFDVSSAWASFIADYPLFVSTQKEIVASSGMRIWEMTFSKSDGQQVHFNIDFSKDGVASPNGRMAGGEGHSQFARQGSQDFMAEVVLDRDSGSAKPILRQRLIPQPQLRARIGTVKKTGEDSYEVEVLVKTPFDFRNVKLNIESSNEQYSVSAKKVSARHDKILFEVKLPQVAQETQLIIQSFSVDERALIFLDEGISLKAPAGRNSEGPLLLKKMQFADDAGIVELSNPRPLESSQARFVITVESPLDIQEIRLGFRETFSNLTPEAYFVNGQVVGEIPSQKIESLRSSYFLSHYDSSQFTQVRKGKFVEISIPIKDYTGDLGSPYSQRGAETIVAVNEGARAITTVEVVDRGLRSLNLYSTGKSIPYIIKTPRTRTSDHFRQVFRMSAPLCSKVFHGL